MDTTCLANGQRQTVILNYETKPKKLLKDSRLLMRPEEVTRFETLQATWWWWWWWWWCLGRCVCVTCIYVYIWMLLTL